MLGPVAYVVYFLTAWAFDLSFSHKPSLHASCHFFIFMHQSPFQIYFPTVTLVGAEMVREIIESGHLMALDTPGVKAKAVSFGDPETLLSEDWIPAVAGANVK